MAAPYPLAFLNQRQPINFEIYQRNFRSLHNRLTDYSRYIYATTGAYSEQYQLFNDRLNQLAQELPRIHRNEINEINASILTLSDLLDDALTVGNDAPHPRSFDNIMASLRHLNENLTNEQNQVVMANVR